MRKSLCPRMDTNLHESIQFLCISFGSAEILHRCHAEVLRSICAPRLAAPDPSRSTAQDDNVRRISAEPIDLIDSCRFVRIRVPHLMTFPTIGGRGLS